LLSLSHGGLARGPLASMVQRYKIQEVCMYVCIVFSKHIHTEHTTA